jgi:hypothetical protein
MTPDWPMKRDAVALAHIEKGCCKCDLKCILAICLVSVAILTPLVVYPNLHRYNQEFGTQAGQNIEPGMILVVISALGIGVAILLNERRKY